MRCAYVDQLAADRRQCVCRCGRVIHGLLQSVTVGAQHVQHAAVHHPFEAPLVEIPFRLLFRFHGFDGRLTVPVLCGPVLFPTPIVFLPAFRGAIFLLAALATWPKLLTAYFANHCVSLIPKPVRNPSSFAQSCCSSFRPCKRLEWTSLVCLPILDNLNLPCFFDRYASRHHGFRICCSYYRKHDIRNCPEPLLLSNGLD